MKSQLIFSLILGCVFVSTLNARELTLRERLQGKTVGAHQGGSISLDGNTISRFQKAYEEGVDIVEMDLQVTKDGVVIISHDEKLDPITTCKGLIADKTWAEVQKCRRFLKYKIPSFEEVLQWSNGKAVVDAEFKTLMSIIPALDLVKKYNAYNWVYFQAKEDPERYTIARDHDKNVALLYVVSNQQSLDYVLSLNDENLPIVEVNQNSHTPYYIDALHDAGKLVTEDSWHYSKTRELFKASCTPAFRAGIDIPVTDRPKSCLKQRDNL